MRSYAKTALALIFISAVGAAALRPALAQTNYIAVGDSLAYGYQNDTLTPTGAAAYPGYTQAVTQYLASQTGAAVTFTGLGINGETTGTLIGNPNQSANNPSLNSYYTSAETQLTALQKELASHPESLVTIQVGANDFLDLLQQPAFQTAVFTNNTVTVNAMIATTASTAAANYVPLLAAVKADPQAHVLILGDYNPFANLLADNPTHATDPTYQLAYAIAPPLTAALNNTLAATAQSAGYQFVNLDGAFSSYTGTDPLVRDTELDNGLPNIHPTDAGYAVIAGQVESALTPAPEPSQGAVFSIGALSIALIILLARRRKSAAS